jgi:hypothetical protein
MCGVATMQSCAKAQRAASLRVAPALCSQDDRWKGTPGEIRNNIATPAVKRKNPSNLSIASLLGQFQKILCDGRGQ